MQTWGFPALTDMQQIQEQQHPQSNLRAIIAFHPPFLSLSINMSYLIKKKKALLLWNCYCSYSTPQCLHPPSSWWLRYQGNSGGGSGTTKACTILSHVHICSPYSPSLFSWFMKRCIQFNKLCIIAVWRPLAEPQTQWCLQRLKCIIID